MHLHEPLVPSLSLMALWQGGVPAVGTFHAAADSSRGYRFARPLLAALVGRLAVRTAVSDAARALVARYFPGDYVLTPNGVEVKAFAGAAPAELGRSVLFLGRIERRKGLEVLIQAMVRLKDLGCELVVAGSGPEEGRCRRLASQLGVAARFVGPVDDATKASLLRGATVYCAPGLGGESFGIVLVEAMAAGAPIVCSDLLGFRAVAGAAAVLVPPGEAGLLADALRHLLTDDEARAVRARASARLAAAYDWERLVGGVEACYERAVRGEA
jgi:phosphatidylinositol alpha-mannosyltransferase